KEPDTWAKLTKGGGMELLGKVVKKFLPIVRDPIVAAISHRPLSGLVGRLIDSVGDLFAEVQDLISDFKSKPPEHGVARILEKVHVALVPFVDWLKKSVPKGIGRGLVEVLLDSAMGLIQKPDAGGTNGLIRLVRTIKEGKKQGYAALVGDIVKSLVG